MALDQHIPRTGAKVTESFRFEDTMNFRRQSLVVEHVFIHLIADDDVHGVVGQRSARAVTANELKIGALLSALPVTQPYMIFIKRDHRSDLFRKNLGHETCRCAHVNRREI